MNARLYREHFRAWRYDGVLFRATTVLTFVFAIAAIRVLNEMTWAAGRPPPTGSEHQIQWASRAWAP